MSTLLQQLLPTIDSARGVATTLGVRLYRVFVRVRTWSGSTIGEGGYLDSDTEILPRPRITAQTSGRSPLEQTWTDAGLHYVGNLVVDQISAQLSMAQLYPNTNENQKLYYVVQGADGGEIATALFQPQGPPFRSTTEWQIKLEKIEG